MKVWLTGLFIIAALLVSGAATAAVPPALIQDFTPVEGVVLWAGAGEVMVNAAKEQGVRVGDLFGAISPGETIRHPVSGDVIGRLDKVVGVLSIIQVHAGFATARLLSGTEPAPGGTVRRFDQIKAWFVDPSSTGEIVFSELRAALPQLDWQPYPVVAPGKDGLEFTVRGNVLEVRSAGALLHSYSLPEAARMAYPKTIAPVPVKGAQP